MGGNVQSETPPSDSPTNPRILVANSDPEELRYIAGVLGRAGYLVELADSTAAVAFALEHSPFALAIIDSRMRAYMRHSLTEYLAQFRNVRWIEITDATAFAPAATSAEAVLARPVTPETLLRTVRHILAASPAVLSSDTNSAEHAATDTVSRVLRQRLLEQQALSTLARSLSAVLDLDTLLTQVVDAAVQLCNAEEGLLLLPDEAGQELYVRAAKGMDSETARNFRLKTQDSLAGEVFRTGQPVLKGERGPQKITTAYLVRSLLYVPLSIKGQVIGVLGVNNRLAQRTFSPHDRELLQDLAAHAAVAIENARLYEESVLRARELRTLVQAAEATNSTLAIDRVLSIIASQLIGALNVGQCYIAEWRNEAHNLAPLAIRYRAVWQPTACPTLSPRDNPALQQISHNQQPLVVRPETHEMAPVAVWSPELASARSVLYVPLYAHGKLLGVAIFYRFRTPYPAPIVPQAATTALHRRALQVMVTLVGHDAENYQESLFRDVQAMLSVAEADWCDVALWNANQRRFDVMLSLGEIIWADEERPSFTPSRYEQWPGELVLNQTHTDTDHKALAHLCRDGYGQSLLAVPLVIKGETVGVVFLVDTLHQRRFSQREIRLAQALVSQAANAMDNARLYRDLARSLEELHRTQSKLVQTARLSAMGELAAAVAHQINNPLTTILGDAEMLLSDTSADDPNFEALEAIFRAGKRAHEVVRRLLAMARQQPVQDVRIEIDVNETINNTLALVKSHVEQGNVQLTVHLAEDLPPVTGTSGQLEDVWLNLLLNARDAVAERAAPQVSISTRLSADAQWVEIEVQDNGVGIPDERQKRVFEPFYTTKPPGAGTGLGLHICKQIVEKFGGQIALHSIYNKGTRFVVKLPVSSKRADDEQTLRSDS